MYTNPIFPNASYATPSCGGEAASLLNNESVFEQAMNINPELAKQGIDPGSCSTSQTSNDTTVAGGGLSLGGVGGGYANNNYKKNVSNGCSAVAIQATLTSAIQNSLNCTAQSIQKSTATDLGSSQTFTVNLNNDVIDGPITNNQGNSETVQLKDFTQIGAVTSLTNSVQNSLNSWAKQAQTQKTTNTFTTPTAQKSLQKNVQSAIGGVLQTNVEDLVQTTLNSLQNTQTFTLNINNSTLDSNASITNNQTDVLESMMTEVTKNVVSNVMKASSLNKMINKTLNEQYSSTGSNLGLILGVIGGILLLAFGVYVYRKSKEKKAKSTNQAEILNPGKQGQTNQGVSVPISQPKILFQKKQQKQQKQKKEQKQQKQQKGQL